MTATDINTALPDAYERERAAGSENVVVKCIGLTKIFKDFWLRSRVRAVDNIDLEIHRGEVFGLLGPNGSGKSTTIKMILGLLNATEGTIAVFGKRPENVKNKTHIGYLPEETYLYRFLNARETLDFYGRLFHIPRHARVKRIEMLLEMVGLEHAAHRPVGEYSKGMQRKVGLAQALINDPELLVLDEPTSGMDPVATADVKRLITTLAERGKTVLLCSHLLADVESVVHRAAIMFGGKVREMGDIEALLTNEEMTNLRTSRLDDETIERIEAILNERGKHIEKVERPRQSLEAKFLDIVHKAQAEGLQTSGARSGRDVAAFLAGEEERRQRLGDGLTAEGEDVIDQLMTGAEEPEAKSEAAGETHAADAADEKAIRAEAQAAAAAEASVISDLIAPEPEAEPEPEATAEVDERDTPMSTAGADLSVIDGLLDEGAAGDATPTPDEAATAPEPAAPSQQSPPSSSGEVYTAEMDDTERTADRVPNPPVAQLDDGDAASPGLDDSAMLGAMDRADDRKLDHGGSASDASESSGGGYQSSEAGGGLSGAVDDAQAQSQSSSESADTDTKPAKPSKSDDGSEQPDQSFIDALMDVPPPAEDDEQKGNR